MPLSIFALTLDEALKIWENAYRQGYQDAIAKNENIKVVLPSGYYVAVPSSSLPDYIKGLLRFDAKKVSPVNYIGVEKGGTLLLLYSTNPTEARYYRDKFEKLTGRVLDLYGVNPFVLKVISDVK